MSIALKLKKKGKTPRPPSRDCFLDGRTATPGLFLNQFLLCQNCRDWIMYVKEYKYVAPGVQITLREIGRRPIAGRQGIVECSRCGAFLKANDFRRHRCIRILKTQTYKLDRILKAYRGRPRW